MVEVHVVVEDAEALRRLRDLPDGVDRAVRVWLPKVGQLGVAIMRDVTRPLLKRPKGALLASVRAEVDDGGVRVGPNVPYAAFVNDGTRPHVIRPRDRQALTIPLQGGFIGTRGRVASGLPRRITRFPAGSLPRTGSVHFAKIVHHPGTTGYRYVEKTAGALRAPAAALLAAEVRREVERAR